MMEEDGVGKFSGYLEKERRVQWLRYDKSIVDSYVLMQEG